jgi:methylmalonyl-CoA/ethylmalonyl-CoA epimerase
MQLHHIGIVVDSIDRHSVRYRDYLGLTPLAPPVIDPVQGVRIQFWGDGGTTAVELIEPASASSTVTGFLKKGGGLHHLCYQVDDIESALAHAESLGALCTCSPVRAPALDNRRVCFVVYRDLGLVEFVERNKHE